MGSPPRSPADTRSSSGYWPEFSTSAGEIARLFAEVGVAVAGKMCSEWRRADHHHASPGGLVPPAADLKDTRTGMIAPASHHPSTGRVSKGDAHSHKRAA